MMKITLEFIHQLEQLQLDMRAKKFFTAANSLDGTIELLKGEYRLSVMDYENSYSSYAK